MKVHTAILIFILTASAARAELTVFAAASTTDVMRRLAVRFEETGGEKIRFNFAGSGALARQINAGAPADIFISANTEWMDFLENKSLLTAQTRSNIAANALVLITPSDSTMTYEEFPSNLKGKLGVGEFKSVPAGTYAQAALQSLGWLGVVQRKLVKGSNVRTVLMYVERGEVDAGIVYLTDAKQSDKVRIIGTFPADAHPPILYPAAACTKKPSAVRFMHFMNSSDARRIFETHGFSAPPK